MARAADSRLWRALGSVGLTRERWERWPANLRNGAIALVAGAVLLPLIVPRVRFDGSLYIGYAVLVVLVVQPWTYLAPRWWQLLGRFGLSHERTRAWPAWARHGVIWAVLGSAWLVLIAAFGGFNASAIVTVLVIGALVVPPWSDVAVVGRAIVPAGVLAVVVMYPFYVDHMFTMPIFGSFPDVFTGVVMLVFIMMACGLNIVVGYAGLLDLGYVAFYALGAYSVAWFASLQFPQQTVHFGAVGIDKSLAGFHISVWLLLILAAAITSVGGIIIGVPTLRLRGDYLAIVTLGFGEILPQIARNGDNFLNTGFNLTNGPNGITPIDQPGFGERISDVTGGFLPASYPACCTASVLGHQVNPNDIFFWTAVVLLLFTVFCSWRLRDSRLGRAWIAIREDEIAASAMGVPLMRTKTWAYASGAFFGGIAGGFFASFKGATFPGDFIFNISVFILTMIILGGMGNIWGVLVGAGFLAYLNQAGLANTGAWLNDHGISGFLFGKGTQIDVPLYASGIYGTIILIVMLFRPEGLIPDRRRQVELHAEETHDESLYEVTH